MPTKHPRLNITLEDQYMGLVAQLADRKGQSMSMAAKDLILKALELEEDLYLSSVAAKRDNEDSKWVTEEEAWK